jgi:hypothetical protein
MNGIPHVHEQHPFYVQAMHDHAHLHQAVEEIHQLLANRVGGEINCEAVTQATDLIVALREQLRLHFEREELGGYLEEALTRVPALAPQAAQLQKQHAEFLQLAEQMTNDAKCGEQPAVIWTRLTADYTRFAKKLLAHEAAENQLLERAFNEDMGVEP